MVNAVIYLHVNMHTYIHIAQVNLHIHIHTFLVCTHIVHHTKKKLVYYSGNYDSFVKTREEKEEVNLAYSICTLASMP